MKRRTFSRKTGALSLAAILSPMITTGQSAPTQITLSPGMREHLDLAKREMSLGIQTRQQNALLKKYLEPVKVVRHQITQTGYQLSFQNQYRHTVTLSLEDGQKCTAIQC